MPFIKDRGRIFNAAHFHRGLHLPLYRAIKRSGDLGIKFTNYSNDLRIFINNCLICFPQSAPKEKPKSYSPLQTTR